MTTKQQKRAAGESIVFLGILAVIVVLSNVLGVFVHARVDLTEKEFFSLSSGSKRLASTLEDQMEIRAYFTEDLPPPHNATERYVRDLLAEYRDASGGKIKLQFIQPSDDEEKKAAERDGVRRVQDQALDGDSLTVRAGYRGISFHYLGESKAIARVDRTAGLEYEITQTIKELVGEKISIGVLGGHDGPSLQKGVANLRGYLPTYNLREVKADEEIPKDLKALLIIHPGRRLTDTELQRINQYVMNGGNLGVFGGGTKITLDQGGSTATPMDAGLNRLLEKWGVSLEPEIVADAQCSRAPMRTQFGFQIPVPYPVAPVVTFDEDQRKHPALFRIDQVPFHFTTHIGLNDALANDKQVKRTILARSTEQSWLMSGENIDLKPRESWRVPGYDGPYTLGVALEGKLPSAYADAAVTSPTDGEPVITAPARTEHSAHILVLGTGFFLRDEVLRPTQGKQIFGGPVAFALNSIDWLANDSDLIEIRAKTIEEPTLEVPKNVKEAEATIRTAVEEQDEEKAKAAFQKRKAAIKAWDTKRNLYRWGNTLGLPVFFALFGVLRWRLRLARKAALKL